MSAPFIPTRKWLPVKRKDGTITAWIEVFRIGNTTKYASIPGVSRTQLPHPA